MSNTPLHPLQGRPSLDSYDLDRPLMEDLRNQHQSLPNQSEMQHFIPQSPGKKGNATRKNLNMSILQTQHQNDDIHRNVDEIEMLQHYFDETTLIQGCTDLQTCEDAKPTNRVVQFLEEMPVFTPNSLGMLLWKMLIGGIVVLFFFEIPIYICYSDQVWDFIGYTAQRSIMITSFVLMILDIVLEFFTAYFLHGNLVSQKSKIANNYIETYFVWDLIAVLGFGIRALFEVDSYRYLFLVFYLKFPSLFKIDYQFEEATLLHRKTRTCFNFFKIIVILQFCFLLFACGFYLIGEASVEGGLNSWLLNDGNFGVIRNMEPTKKFFFSYYFSLGTMTTTMGYGDITPLNVYECSFCLGGIFFAVFIFQVNVNSLFKIMDEFNIYPLKIYRYRVAINRFMKTKNVSPQVQERVRQYLNQGWYEQGNRDIFLEQMIFTELAPHLKQELMFSSLGIFLQELPLFRQFSKQFLKELALSVVEVNYSQGENIILDRNGENTDDMAFYYINTGSVVIYANIDSPRQLLMKKLTVNEYFGEWSFFTGLDRQASADAYSYSNLYKISRLDLLNTLAKFPLDHEQYFMIRDTLIYSQDLSIIGSSCWTCGQNNHYNINCDSTHYKPDCKLIIKLQYQSGQQQRQQYNRIDRIRWPTVKYQQKLTVRLSSRKLTQQAKSVINEMEMQNMMEQRKQQAEQNAPIKNMSLQASKQSKQFYIHGNLRDMDRPYQFKAYFPRDNYEYKLPFRNIVPEIGMHRISIAQDRMSIAYAIQKKY